MVAFENGLCRIYRKDQLETLQEEDEADYVSQWVLFKNRPTRIKIKYPYLIATSS